MQRKYTHHHLVWVVGRAGDTDVTAHLTGWVPGGNQADNPNDVVVDVFPLHIYTMGIKWSAKKHLRNGSGIRDPNTVGANLCRFHTNFEGAR